MKIGLIAMSGIRCCDEELLRLGLTLPGFVERSKTIASLPSLGLLTLAGMTPAEHSAEYIEVPDIRDIEQLESFDMVAISTYSAQVAEAYDLADRYRGAGAAVVIGGPHVSALPDEAAEHCDSVVIGEGECSWRDVLDDCQRGRLKQFYYPSDGGFDLADSPMPAFRMLDIARYNRLLVQTSRGCPHRCEFCAGSILITERYKQKPVSKVLAEIERILAIWPRPFIEFADDNSFVDKEYWRELLGALKNRRIKWFAETDLSIADDDELLDMMRQAGCEQVLIGLESPTVEALDGLETRSNWKHDRWSAYKDAIGNIQSHGITVNGCFIIGLDSHGPDICDQVFEFVKDSGLYEVQVTVPTAFPGTPFYERLKNEGRIISDRDWAKCTLFDVNFVPDRMTPEQLSDAFRSLVVRLYNEEFTSRRRRQFFERLHARNNN